jgi:hypothetical protein
MAGLGELGASRILNLGVGSAAFDINDFGVEARALRLFSNDLETGSL